MGCNVELSDLPLLAGCPGNNEWFIVGNAVGGSGHGKYARRRYADLKSCILAGLSFVPLQFEIGQLGSPMIAGETALVITIGNPIEDSEIVVLDNNFMEPNLSDQISYTVSYSTTEIIITFNQGVILGQKYFIKYAHI